MSQPSQQLVAQPQGSYRYLPSGGPNPFCSAVVAEPDHEIVHAVLDRPLPWRQGFQLIEAHLKALGRPRQALCSIELRAPEPYTPEGFRAFNVGYAELLQEWGLFKDGVGSTTRTNVAVDLNPPAEQVLYAFAYTAPAPGARPTFVLSGAPERPELRTGSPSPDVVRAMAADVLTTLDGRLRPLGLTWDTVTELGVYTMHDLWPALRAEVLPRLGLAAVNGVHWYPSRPPVAGTEIELDARSVRQEVRVASQ
jgi:hypothetical protein